LELVRQRDALGQRVLFAQLAMVSSRVLDQEVRAKKQEEVQKERLERLERIVFAQDEKIGRLEELMHQVVREPSLVSHETWSLPTTTTSESEAFDV